MLLWNGVLGPILYVWWLWTNTLQCYYNIESFCLKTEYIFVTIKYWKLLRYFINTTRFFLSFFRMSWIIREYYWWKAIPLSINNTEQLKKKNHFNNLVSQIIIDGGWRGLSSIRRISIFNYSIDKNGIKHIYYSNQEEQIAKRKRKYDKFFQRYGQ